MFYQVRVLDKVGDVKKVISSKRLSQQFWDRHSQPQEFTGKNGYDDHDTDTAPEWKPDISAGKVKTVDEVYE